MLKVTNLPKTGIPGQHQPGFSLLELMVTMAIVGIVTVAAVPGMRVFVANNKIAAEYNRFTGVLQYARSEAVTRNANVTICSSSDVAAATPACDNSEWQAGWILFTDLNGNKTIDGGDTLLRVGDAIEGDITIVKDTFGEGTASYSIQFNGNGRPVSDGEETYSFLVCDYRGPDEARGINVSRTGRINRASTGSAGGSGYESHPPTLEDGNEATSCEVPTTS